MRKKSQDIFRFSLLLAILILINVIGQLRFFRLDLTSEKRFTLSPATIELIERVEDVLLVRIYLDGDFPAGFQRLQSETRQMLDEFRAYNPRIQYEFINPNGLENQQEREELIQQLQGKGLRPYQLRVQEEGGGSVKTIFPGAIMSLGEREASFSLLVDQLGAPPETQINSSIQNLEFQLANTLRSLVVRNKPLVGFLQGHGEPEPRYLADFANTLAKNYQVNLFNLREFKADSLGPEGSILAQQRRLNRFDAIVIAKPQQPFNDLDKFLLDQYVMNGGRTLWLIDPVKAEIDSLSENPRFLSLPILRKLNIDDLLFKYGVRLKTNLVRDMVAAALSDQQQVRPWVYFPLVMPTVDHPITKDLNAVWLQFASTLDTLPTEGSRKTILLQSSPYTSTHAAPHLVDLGFYYNPPPRERFNQGQLPLAVLVEGSFQSLYRNRVTPKENGQALKVKGEVENNQMIVVGDGDIIRNQLNIVNQNIPRGAPLPLGFDQFTGQQYGNRDFLLNAVDYLLDDTGLISIRSRDLKIRLLDLNRVQDERLRWQLLNTLAPLLMILLFALINTFIRRKKYAAR